MPLHDAPDVTDCPPTPAPSLLSHPPCRRHGRFRARARAPDVTPPHDVEHECAWPCAMQTSTCKPCPTARAAPARCGRPHGCPMMTRTLLHDARASARRPRRCECPCVTPRDAKARRAPNSFYTGPLTSFCASPRWFSLYISFCTLFLVYLRLINTVSYFKSVGTACIMSPPDLWRRRWRPVSV